MKNTVTYLLILTLALISMASSCSKYQQVLKSSDLKLKERAAREYYEDGDYMKAIPLLEESITLNKGNKDIDELYYLYAMSHYYQASYLVAAFHFKNIHDSYTHSEYAQESLYMSAYCYYRLSPDIKLDQTYTEKAIDAFQLYVNYYPDSERVQDCNDLIDIMRRKMERKAFANAKLYYKMRRYQAAATSFENILVNYPDTEDAEEIYLYIIKSYYFYAINSVEEKQEERFQDVKDAYKLFTKRYPESRFAEDAKDFYTKAGAQLQEL